MKIRCEDVIPVLTDGKTLSPEMEEHVGNCPDCALLRKICAFPAAEDEIAVPEALDRAVLRAAHRGSGRSAGKWKVWKFVLPAAASFAVCFSLLFYSMNPRTHQVEGSKMVSVSLNSSWNGSDFDENMISLSCDAAGGVNAFNFYDSI